MPVPNIITSIRNIITKDENQDKELNTVKSYNLLTATGGLTPSVRTSSVNPVPTAGWTAIDGTNLTYSSGGFIIGASHFIQGQPAYRAVDADPSSYWRSATTTNAYFYIQLPAPIKAQSIALSYVCTNDSGHTGPYIEIYGGQSFESANTLLYSNSSSSFNGNSVIPSGSQNNYSVYKLVFPRTTSNYTDLYNFNISGYTVSTYPNIVYSLPSSSSYPTTWQNGQRLLVKSPASIPTGAITGNSLGTTSIDTVLKTNTNYELVYDTNKFKAREVV